MTFYQLACRYLLRKKGKTMILFLILLFVSSMILSTTIILHSAEDAKASIQKKTNAKIVLDIVKSTNKITAPEAEDIRLLDEVSAVNRLASHPVFPSGFHPVTGSASLNANNQMVSLLSYDDLEKDSGFTEEKYRLTAGKFISANTRSSVVIDTLLAEANGLKLGDAMAFETADGRKSSARIIGLFRSGGESKQTNSISSVNRMENQIFTDNNTYLKLFPNDGFYQVAVYAENPTQLEVLQTKLEQITGRKAEMTASDTLYQQLKAPLEQITRVTRLMLILTVSAGTIVVSLLLCMWMRTRRKETAILISMGKKQPNIFLQRYLETLFIFIFSVLGACCLGRFMAGLLQSLLVGPDTADTALNVMLQFKDITALLLLGSFVVITAVTISLLPILGSNKNTIAMMEES